MPGFSASRPTRARDIKVGALTDGRSGARVFRIVVPEAEVGFVAKFDDVGRLSDEYATARLVMPATQPLAVEIYALRGAAVLLQRLVTDNDEPLRGAPSFAERIEARGAWERGRRRNPEPLPTDLLQGVDRVLRTLKQIPAQAAGSVTSRCWMRVEPLDELAGQGVTFRIDSSSGPFDLREDSGRLRHGRSAGD